MLCINIIHILYSVGDLFVTCKGTTSPLEQRGSTTAIPEEVTLDYAEITSIPPLPLWTLLAADKETLTKPQGNDDQQVTERAIIKHNFF